MEEEANSPWPNIKKVEAQWRRNHQLRSKVRTWALKYKRKAKNCIKKRGNPPKILCIPLQEAQKTQKNKALRILSVDGEVERGLKARPC